MKDLWILKFTYDSICGNGDLLSSEQKEIVYSETEEEARRIGAKAAKKDLQEETYCSLKLAEISRKPLSKYEVFLSVAPPVREEQFWGVVVLRDGKASFLSEDERDETISHPRFYSSKKEAEETASRYNSIYSDEDVFYVARRLEVRYSLSE